MDKRIIGYIFFALGIIIMLGVITDVPSMFFRIFRLFQLLLSGWNLSQFLGICTGVGSWLLRLAIAYALFLYGGKWVGMDFSKRR